MEIWKEEQQEEINCVIHSRPDDDKVGKAKIIGKYNDQQYIAEYNGVKCTAIFNPFTCYYYVDDKYGIIPELNN